MNSDIIHHETTRFFGLTLIAEKVSEKLHCVKVKVNSGLPLNQIPAKIPQCWCKKLHKTPEFSLWSLGQHFKAI